MDLQSAVALSTLPGISKFRAAAVFRHLREHQDQRPVTLERVVRTLAPDADVGAIVTEARAQAADLLASAERASVTPVQYRDASYPPLVHAIRDPPPVLWVRGCLEPLTRPAVAIVGSRAATPYALEVARRLAADLAARGLVIVSGLARGADGAAHRGCVDAGGATIAVLGSGPDVIYPAEHGQLAASICEKGTLVSELGPGAPPLQEHFPARNRLISGISLAVVVVEASEKSGSLITARCALEQGRDVMAVPGSILSGRNRGSHALLKDGAKVVETADDILEELGWPGLRAAPGQSDNSLDSGDLLGKMAPGEEYGLDELAELAGVPGRELLPRMTDWELQGRVQRVPGGRFRRPVPDGVT